MAPEMHPQWGSLNFAALFAKGAAFVNTDAQNSILNPNGVLSFKISGRAPASRTARCTTFSA